MRKHTSLEVEKIHERFRSFQLQIESVFGGEPKFQSDDLSQLYKALLKTSMIIDGNMIKIATKLALDFLPDAGVSQIYPMLHLPNDTSERGNWHRDDRDYDRRVFWIPVCQYDYAALSVIPNSDGVLSRPLSIVYSRGFPPFMSRKVFIDKNDYYSWSSRLVHRGNLNTSEYLGAAFVMFLDRKKKSIAMESSPLSPVDLRKWTESMYAALTFNSAGNIIDVNYEIINQIPIKIRQLINSFF